MALRSSPAWSVTFVPDMPPILARRPSAPSSVDTGRWTDARPSVDEGVLGAGRPAEPAGLPVAADVVDRGDPPAGAQDVGALGADEHEAEVEGLHLGQVVLQTGHPLDQLLERRDVDGVGPAVAEEERGGLDVADDVGGVGLSERRDAERL